MTNKTNANANITQEALEHISILAKTAVNTAMRTIEMKTGDLNIHDLRKQFQVDLKLINNPVKTSYVLSDAYDLYTTAYAYLYEQIIINGLNENSVVGQKQYKGTLKDITVFVQACKTVNQYINAQKNKYSTTKESFNTTYIEDMEHNEHGELIGNNIIKVTKHYDIDNYADYMELMDMQKDITDKLTPYQNTILKFRLQGISVSKIAEKFNVSHVAISKQLAKIQDITKELYPDKIRGFKDKRNHK